MKVAILMGALMLGGCASLSYNPENPINTVKVEKFRCNCSDVNAAISSRDVFVGYLHDNANFKLAKDKEAAELVIEATMTTTSASVRQRRGRNYVRPVTSGREGDKIIDVVTGITVVAKRDGKLIATEHVTQRVGKKTRQPEYLAKKAADGILEALYENGLEPK